MTLYSGFDDHDDHRPRTPRHRPILTALNSIFFPLPTSIRRLTPRGSLGSRAHRTAPRHRLAPQHGPSNYGSPPNAARSAAMAGLARLRKASSTWADHRRRHGLLLSALSRHRLRRMVSSVCDSRLGCRRVSIGRDDRDPGLHVSLLPAI